MTYYNDSFADWPTLPEELSNIQQISYGLLNRRYGLWALTESELFFLENLGSKVNSVDVENVSATLELEVVPGSRLVLDVGGHSMYLVTPSNVTLLDCNNYYED